MRLLAALAAALALAAPARGANRVTYALRIASATYGVPYAELYRVAWCESRLNPRAVNRSSGAAGLFQVIEGTWATTPYARFSRLDAVPNALAAAWIVRRDGGWREWTCSP